MELPIAENKSWTVSKIIGVSVISVSLFAPACMEVNTGNSVILN